MAHEPALVAWLREPGPRTAAGARNALADAGRRDSLAVAWQLVSERGDTLVRGSPPFAVSTTWFENALEGSDSGAIGRLIALRDTLFYPVAAMAAEGGRRLGWVIFWRRSPPNPNTRAQIRALVGDSADLLLGSYSGGWTNMLSVVPQPLARLASDTGIAIVEVRGEPVLMAMRAIPAVPWWVAIEQPMSRVLAPARAFLRRIALAAVLLSAIALAIAWWQGHRISAPLRAFTDAAMAMTSADYSKRVNVPGHDELAQLAIAFNAMAERVEDEVSARFRAELQWRNVFSFNPQPMWVIDVENMRFLAVNSAAVRHYGWAEAEFLQMTLEDIRPPEEIPRLRAAFGANTGESLPTETWRHRRKDGSEIDVEISARDLIFDGRRGRLTIAQDVTARKALEQDLRQAQKMEAVGRLAAGVAHDFNNVLAVILTYAELLRTDLPPGDSRATELDEIMRAARHAGTLTRQLLAFSRQQVVRPVVLDLAEVARNLERMIRPLLGPGIAYTLRSESGTARVKADPAQIEQVLLNLVINARDAMPAGGTLTIETGQAGPEVTLTVRDTGVGMSEEVQARAFEPFYTTKEEGKGTGLGLATAYGIVAQAGGRIEMHSRPGEGATFMVYLPESTEQDEPAPRPAPAPAAATGTGTVLVVDDEAAVLGVVANILRRHGYQVLTAANGGEALAAAAAHGKPLDLLLSDVVMPGMDGPGLLARLRERQPGLRAMFMSGYAGDSLGSRDLTNTDIPFLEKPFTMAVLLEKLREALA